MKAKLPSLLLLLAASAACNEKVGTALLLTETEPNDSFATGNLLGALSSNGEIEITGDVEFDDPMNSDLLDSFLILAQFTGAVTITLTPDEALAEVSFVEELSSTTDGLTVVAAGAGLPASGDLDVTSGQALHFRVLTGVANTGYTLNIVRAPMPLLQSEPEAILHTWTLDGGTGKVTRSTTEFLPGF